MGPASGEVGVSGGGLLSAGTNSLRKRGKKGQAGPAGHMVVADETGKLGWS